MQAHSAVNHEVVVVERGVTNHRNYSNRCANQRTDEIRAADIAEHLLAASQLEGATDVTNATEGHQIVLQGAFLELAGGAVRTIEHAHDFRGNPQHINAVNVVVVESSSNVLVEERNDLVVGCGGDVDVRTNYATNSAGAHVDLIGVAVVTDALTSCAVNLNAGVTSQHVVSDVGQNPLHFQRLGVGGEVDAFSQAANCLAVVNAIASGEARNRVAVVHVFIVVEVNRSFEVHAALYILGHISTLGVCVGGLTDRQRLCQAHQVSQELAPLVVILNLDGHTVSLAPEVQSGLASVSLKAGTLLGGQLVAVQVHKVLVLLGEHATLVKHLVVLAHAGAGVGAIAFEHLIFKNKHHALLMRIEL